MKKLLGIVVLSLLWCNIGFAECIEGDCVNGYGAFISDDGHKYVGEYKDGLANGQGTATAANGVNYAGEWKDDFPNGEGTMTFPSGNNYFGEFKDGNYNGQGTFTWASGEFAGDKFVGEWKNNKR